jgi:hypothetical protein
LFAAALQQSLFLDCDSTSLTISKTRLFHSSISLADGSHFNEMGLPYPHHLTLHALQVSHHGNCLYQLHAIVSAHSPSVFLQPVVSSSPLSQGSTVYAPHEDERQDLDRERIVLLILID